MLDGVPAALSLQTWPEGECRPLGRVGGAGQVLCGVT